jgi:hypothetical protein
MKVSLDSPKGYVCQYLKEPPCEVFADVNQFDRSLDVLVTVLYAKDSYKLQYF